MSDVLTVLAVVVLAVVGLLALAFLALWVYGTMLESDDEDPKTAFVFGALVGAGLVLAFISQCPD